MPPFRTSVVRLVSYRREEYLDRHPPHAPAANERPFLFLLSPDTLQLVTASDAPDSPPAVSTLLQQVSLKPADRPPRRPAVRPLALLHKLAHSGQPAGEGTPRDAPAGAEDSSAQWLGEELEEGQFMTFSIALSQIAGVEIQEGRHIKVRGGGGEAPAGGVAVRGCSAAACLLRRCPSVRCTMPGLPAVPVCARPCIHAAFPLPLPPPPACPPADPVLPAAAAPQH